MSKYIQIGILVVAVYLGWTFGWPWVQRQVGRSRAPVSNPAEGRGGRCVQMAARASEAYGEQILGSAQGLMERGEWQGIIDFVRDEVSTAASACSRCDLESCGLGREALADLRRLVSTAEGGARSSQSVPLHSSRDHQKVNQKLWEAHELAGRGR